MRADHWLRQHYPALSRRHIEEAMARRLVRTARGGTLVKGAAITVASPPDCVLLDRYLELLGKGNSTLQIPVLRETDAVVALDKPPGTPSHPISLFDADTVTNWAIARYPEILDWVGGCQPTITPHRLDTDTSGVLLVARTGAAYAAWRRRFSEKKVAKHYLAWCWGQGPPVPRDITAAITHDPADRRKMMCFPPQQVPHSGRKFAAATTARTLQQLEDRFLCELQMHTGVTHQIRVHMASLGTPLLGDRLYDPACSDRAGQYPHTLLRCTRLQCAEFSVQADGEDFSRQFQ